MRITREKLLNFAQMYVKRQLDSKLRPVCIYLTGSLLWDDPMIGGSTDIDLVYIHDSEPPLAREIIRVTDEVHLDIAHLNQEIFRYPRQLRTDPWLGSYLCYNPRLLHDSQHWFEFTQAGAGAQFDLPGYVIERARPLEDAARQTWLRFQSDPPADTPHRVYSYLKMCEQASNAIACLSGPPLTERRFLLQFPERAQAVRRPGLVSGLVDLFTSDESLLQAEKPSWADEWKETLTAAASIKTCPPRLQEPRINYYTHAVDELWGSTPAAALWILLRTWTAAVCLPDIPSNSVKAWKNFLQELKLDETQLENRLDMLDAYLDSIEEALDIWAQENGLSTL